MRDLSVRDTSQVAGGWWNNFEDPVNGIGQNDQAHAWLSMLTGVGANSGTSYFGLGDFNYGVLVHVIVDEDGEPIGWGLDWDSDGDGDSNFSYTGTEDEETGTIHFGSGWSVTGARESNGSWSATINVTFTG